MNIIVLNDYGSVTGGATQVALSSLNALADAGHTVSFIFSVGPVDRGIDRSRVKVHSFGFHDLLSNPSRFSAALYGLWDLRCAAQFAKILDSYSPVDTIIHLHSWSKSLSSSVVRTAVKRGFNIVCTLHDYFTVCPNGGLYDYQLQHACNIEPMSFSCISSNCDARSYSQKLWRVGRQLVQQHIGKIPDGITNYITVSDYSEKIFSRFLPRDAVFYRVSNPITIEKQSPAMPQYNSDFSFVGRLSPEKGAVLFAKASKLSGVCASFIGDGQEHAGILAANPDSKMLGWLSHDAVIQKIKSSRALVFPSLCHETQGLAVMEAAALGIPAIVSDACAARDNIVDGETGLLFRSDNVDSLASKLQLLGSDHQLVTDLGNAAYIHYWSAPCTQERHAAELVSCYENILASNG